MLEPRYVPESTTECLCHLFVSSFLFDLLVERSLFSVRSRTPALVSPEGSKPASLLRRDSFAFAPEGVPVDTLLPP